MSVLLEPNCIDQHFGIEVASCLNWEHWQPGGEYTQQITLKNVNLKTKKLKYRITSTRFFTTRYPQPIVLSSGTSISLPITFRPLEKDTYEDFIEFITKEGEFRVPMKATLPEAQLKLPEKIEFGMCAVQDQLSLDFKISNTSKLQTTFQLYCEHPFLLTPASGTLAPRTSCKITANFKPQGAFVYEEDAICIFGKDKEEKLEKKIKLEGIGKFSHIGIEYGKESGDNIVIDYGDVGVGEVVEKIIEIINYTAVTAPFEILQKRRNVSVDKCFSSSHYHGNVPASGSMKVKLIFQPESVNMTYVDNFEIIPIGGTSKSCVKCVGTGKGADLIIDSRSINFGATKPGEEVTRSFKIKNNSSLPAVYQFQTDPVSSVFKLNSPCGTIMGKSSNTVIIQFIPTKPIVYYKRLICLIHNQEPLTLEMFGTCCTNEEKPVVLSRQHLSNYQVHMKRGISRLSPEHILELIEENKIVSEDDGTLQITDDELNNSVEKQSVQLTPFEEFFNDGSEEDICVVMPHICLDVRNIDFGKCKDNVIVQKTLNVSNRTRGKVVCSWITCENSNFSVLPVESDIQPLSTVSFTVIFRPNAPAKFYSCELEAFVFYKSMRDHRLVDEKYITPPWCLTAILTGHTFPKHFETYLPVCTWDSLSMIFPPATSTEESVYRTCLLQNKGSNPIHYLFENDITKIFGCKPSTSLLRGQYQIIVFRMSPMEAGILRKSVGCILNDTDKYKVNFELSMTTEVPEVQLSPNDFVYFKPTCLGNVSQQKVSIHNTSRVSLRLKWKIAEVDQHILTVAPAECLMLPNEVQQHDWSFTPSVKMKHLFKAKLYVSIDGLESEAQRYVLRFIGEGQTGTISCDDTYIVLGDTIVGEYVRKTIHLHNDSNCSLLYKLHVHQSVSNSIISMDSRKEDYVLKLDRYEGFIPSSSYQPVEVIVQPKQQLCYNCSISYSLEGLKNQEYEDVVEEHDGDTHQLCNVMVNGVYPLFHVSDIRGSGCVEHYSKKHLWNLFNLSNFNGLLKSEPSPMELKYHITSRHSTRRRMPVSTLAVNEFNFGSSIIGNLPCVININIENKGESATAWSIKYPTDLQLEMEVWADPGELDEDELHEMYVMNSSLFTVQPKNGNIEPGQSQTVVFTYKHDSLGMHKLPILFKLAQGREIRINLVGTTLEPVSSSLHFTTFSHQFSEVSIGTVQPAMQTYTLNNGSGQVVKFMFDTTVLDYLQQENYYWKIFECLTPQGEIQPLQNVETYWIFSPIEAKSYQVDIPLYISNGDGHVITFSGVGYDPNQKPHKLDDEHTMDDVLTKQLIYVPDQLMKLSAESIHFGDVPLYTEANQIIFLANISSEKVISFQWNLKGTSAEQLLTIHPSHGYLKPEENTMCKVKVFSTGPPSIHDVDITCEVTDETLMAKYEAELKIWLERKEEQKHLFVIKDVPDVRPPSGRSNSAKLKALPIATTRSDVDLSRYETLPPIKSENGLKKRKLVEEEENGDIGCKPVPPNPKLIHLNISVNYHTIEEFRQFSSGSIDSHFVQRRPVRADLSENSPARKEEFSTIEFVISMLAKDVIEDKTFLDSLAKLQTELIPYFAMIPKIHNVDEEGGVLEESQTVEETMVPSVRIVIDSADDDQMETTETPENTDDDDRTKAINKDGKYSLIMGNTKMLSDSDIGFMAEMNQRQNLKRDDEFRKLLNDVLENTIYNLLCEADHGEISLTNRPRIIVLPPSDVSLKSPLPS